MKKRKVIIDCDPGIDDALAIMLALSSPEIDVIGITTVAGNVPVDLGSQNALKILKQMDRLDIPVYQGAEQPLKREYHSGQTIHGSDGLGDANLEEVHEVAVHPDAVTFLNQSLRENDDLTIVAIGPFTNIALAMEKELALWEKATIISMGGAYQVSGNMSPVAEFNYWCDPDAARYVYRNTPNPITMVGLDVTRKVVLTPNIVEFVKQAKGDHAAFLERITAFYFDFHWEHEHIIGSIINDPLAIGYLICPELFCTVEGDTDIATEGICAGQSVINASDFPAHPINSHIAVDIDTYSFFVLLLTRVFNLDEDLVQNILSQII